MILSESMGNLAQEEISNLDQVISLAKTYSKTFLVALVILVVQVCEQDLSDHNQEEISLSM